MIKNLKKSLHSKKFRILLYFFFFAGFTLSIVAGNWLKSSGFDIKEHLPTSKEDQMVQELSYLQSQPFNFEELSDYFEKKAKEKGGEYAFDLLAQAQFSSEIDMHLLGHVVGEELYKQKGIDGIHTCTQEFRNACSHAIVIGLFQDQGPAALEKIADACRDAPGAKGAYAMCFHGLGHGVLAYVGYDMAKTKEYCNMTGTIEKGNVEAMECMGGAAMEIVGGGGHDREAWEVMRKEYLNPEDPFSLCTSDLMPENAKTYCIMYLTPFYFEATGGGIHNNDDEQIAKAFELCEMLKGEHENLRMACYGSFGKEFPTIANNLDVRRIWNISDEGLRKVDHWCSLAKVEDGIVSCIRHAIGALLWGGENQVSGAVRLCNIIDEEGLQNTCYEETINNLNHFTKKGDNRREDLCEGIGERFKESCKEKLL